MTILSSPPPTTPSRFLLLEDSTFMGKSCFMLPDVVLDHPFKKEETMLTTNTTITTIQELAVDQDFQLLVIEVEDPVEKINIHVEPTTRLIVVAWFLPILVMVGIVAVILPVLPRARPANDHEG